MKTQVSMITVTKLSVICLTVGTCLVLHAAYERRLKQHELRARLAELGKITSRSGFLDSKTPSNEVQQQCASTLDLVSNLSVRAKAGGSVVNSVLASTDHGKWGIVVSARGTYAVLKDETVMLVKEIPCASLDSIDFHRERANDAELVSESKMSLSSSFGQAYMLRVDDF